MFISNHLHQPLFCQNSGRCHCQFLVTGLGPLWLGQEPSPSCYFQTSQLLGTGGPLQAPLPRTCGRSPAGQSSVHCQQLWLWFFSMSRGHLEMSVLWHHLKSLIRPAWEELGPRLRLPSAPPRPLPSALPELQALNPDKLQHPFATSPWHLPSLTLTPDTSTISIFQVRKPLPSNGLSTPWHHALRWHSSPLGGRPLDWASGRLSTRRLPSSRGLG